MKEKKERILEEANVWRVGNYALFVLYILFVLIVLSHDRGDLAILEGGMPNYKPLNNYIGLVGAHISRILFYLFGLAVYPLLAVLFLRLVRRFVPYKKERKSGCFYALLLVLLGSSILFGMWPQHFCAQTSELGIGHMGRPYLALSGGVIGSKLAAPQVVGLYDAGLIRRFIGDVGTVIVALALLLPGLALLFHRDWYPLAAYGLGRWWEGRMDAGMKARERRAAEKAAAEAEDEEIAAPAQHQSKVILPQQVGSDDMKFDIPAREPEISAPMSQGTDSRPAEEPDVEVRMTVGGSGTRGNARTNSGAVIYDDEDEPIAAPRFGLFRSGRKRQDAPAAPVPAPVPADDCGVIRDDDEVIAPPPDTGRRPKVSYAVYPPGRQPQAVTPSQGQPAQSQPAQSQPAQQYPSQVQPQQRVAQTPPVQTYAPGPSIANPMRATLPVGGFGAREPYRLPVPQMLDLHPETKLEENNEFIKEQSRILQETLESFGVEGSVTRVTIGPRITQYEISLEKGVKVEKVTGIQNNIAMALAAESIRMRAPIPGKNTIGIEVPNKKSAVVYLRPLLESPEWCNSRAALPIILGRDIVGNAVVTDLAKAPHLLIAGSTGSGKSVCMNSLVMSLLFKFSPDDLRLIMVDPKVVELEMYKKLPHLITPVVNDAAKVPLALRWGVNEMERRYRILAKVPVKNLAAFNARPADQVPLYDDDGNRIPSKLPYLIIIIDELADIMMIKEAKVEVETSIARIAQKGRAAGVHLVIATQSPRKEIVTGNIKANLPTKIACKVGSGIDSRVILDTVGAEKLLGAGDMLFNPPGAGIMERIQGSYVSDAEIEKITQEICRQRPQNFDENVMVDHVEISGMDGGGDDDEAQFGRGRDEFDTRDYAGDEYDDTDDSDEGGDISKQLPAREANALIARYLQPGDGELMKKALEIIIYEQRVSTSFLQRRLGIGYNKSAELMDKLEKRNIISPPLPGGQKRNILITDGLQVNNYQEE